MSQLKTHKRKSMMRMNLFAGALLLAIPTIAQADDATSTPTPSAESANAPQAQEMIPPAPMGPYFSHRMMPNGGPAGSGFPPVGFDPMSGAGARGAGKNHNHSHQGMGMGGDNSVVHGMPYGQPSGTPYGGMPYGTPFKGNPPTAAAPGMQRPEEPEWLAKRQTEVEKYRAEQQKRYAEQQKQFAEAARRQPPAYAPRGYGAPYGAPQFRPGYGPGYNSPYRAPYRAPYGAPYGYAPQPRPAY